MRKRIPERFPAPMPSLFGFAPGGVYLAASVASRAVRSYRTLSPLLVRRPNPRSLPASRCAKRDRPAIKRFTFCGTFPGVAPAGRYPAPCFRGARTFLHLGSVLQPRTATAHVSQAAAIRPTSNYNKGGVCARVKRTGTGIENCRPSRRILERGSIGRRLRVLRHGEVVTARITPERRPEQRGR